MGVGKSLKTSWWDGKKLHHRPWWVLGGSLNRAIRFAATNCKHLQGVLVFRKAWTMSGCWEISWLLEPFYWASSYLSFSDIVGCNRGTARRKSYIVGLPSLRCHRRVLSRLLHVMASFGVRDSLSIIVI